MCRSGEGNAKVALKASEALDRYVIEDAFRGGNIATNKGVFVRNGQLFMVSGNGTPQDASRLYVWDLYGKMMRNVIDLSVATRGELTACSVRDGKLYVQSQGNVYQLIF